MQEQLQALLEAIQQQYPDVKGTIKGPNLHLTYGKNKKYVLSLPPESTEEDITSQLETASRELSK